MRVLSPGRPVPRQHGPARTIRQFSFGIAQALRGSSGRRPIAIPLAAVWPERTGLGGSGAGDGYLSRPYSECSVRTASSV